MAEPTEHTTDRSTGSDARGLDAVAVATVLRRLQRHAQAPWLHTEIAQRMAQRLAIIKRQPELVIDWWSTLGAGGELLRHAYPDARIVAVEPDAAWAQQARDANRPSWWRRLAGAQRLEFVTQDEAFANPPQGAQLVWANMMLHGVVDPPQLFERWNALLQVDGFVMFSCLGPGTLRELRDLYASLAWPTPTPAFVDMHDLGDMLVRAGFADPVMDQETLTLQYETPEALLAELRTLGGNAAPRRHPALRTPAWRKKLLRELERLRGRDGRLAVSFEVAYGHAFRAAPRVRPGEATSIPLDDMRAMVRGGRRGRDA